MTTPQHIITVRMDPALKVLVEERRAKEGWPSFNAAVNNLVARGLGIEVRDGRLVNG